MTTTPSNDNSEPMVTIHTKDESLILASLTTLVYSNVPITFVNASTDTGETNLHCGTNLVKDPLVDGYPHGCYVQFANFFRLPGHSITAEELDTISGLNSEGVEGVVGHTFAITFWANTLLHKPVKLYTVNVNIRITDEITGGQIVDQVLGHYSAGLNNIQSYISKQLASVLGYVQKYLPLLETINAGTSDLTKCGCDMLFPESSLLERHLDIVNTHGVELYNKAIDELTVYSDYDVTERRVFSESLGVEFDKAKIETLLSIN